MRLALGPRIFSFVRAIGAATTPPPTTKSDVAPAIKSFDATADPLPIVLNIPTYDPNVFNSLQAVYAVALPAGMPEPADVPSWLTVASPKGQVALAPVPPPNPPDGSIYLPGPEGGDVTITIPGVPNGNPLIQIVLQFDN